MSNKNKNAKRADNGQKNNQKAVANIDRRLRRVEDRTISNQATAKANNQFASKTRKEALIPPAAFLTAAEAEYHQRAKDGRSCMPLVNHNVEESLVKQLFVGKYKVSFSVATGTTWQINVNSATDTTMGSDTPKSFLTSGISRVNAAGTSGTPGPTSPAGGIAAGVTTGYIGAVDSYVTDTSGFILTWANNVDPITPCPFEAYTNDAHSLRWQLGCVRIRAINTTKGADRGGVLYVMSPTNKVDQTAVATDVSGLMNKGIWKAYQDLQCGSEDRPVVIEPRDSLSSFHYADASTTQDLGYSAVFLNFSNNTGVIQHMELFLEVDWVLAGNRVRGIGSPHVTPKEVSERVTQAQNTTRAANILPSEQGKGEHIPAALSLHASPALQAMAAKSVVPRVVHESTLGHIKRLAGKHLPALAETGLQHLMKAATAVFE